jgi:membrane fusion protein, multidrug efflux system
VASHRHRVGAVTGAGTEKDMIKRMIIMLLAVGIVLGGFFGFQMFKANIIKKVMASMANPPQTVSTITAALQDWQPQIEAVGSLRAVKGADLSLEVSGIVGEIDFDSGQDTAAGTVLLRLRSDDDQAKLQALQALADLAQVNYDRDVKQWKAQAIAQQVVDSDNFNLKNARAQVEQQKAMLDKKLLAAPFTGHLGIRAVDVGQYLNAGTAVVTLQALDPIYVDFFLPQQSLNEITMGQAVTARIDTWPDRTFAGKITAINPLVDTGSRNVQVRATLSNPDHKLLPGMYATIDIAVGAPRQQITLPQTAIAYNPYGSTVFLVEANGTARQTFVKTGATRGDQVAVLDGVKAGDIVVTSGQMKLHNGSPVAVDNSVRPSDDAHPVPIDR